MALTDGRIDCERAHRSDLRGCAEKDGQPGVPEAGRGPVAGQGEGPAQAGIQYAALFAGQ